ncbi:oligosaccharide flippase family protein [Candidatus Latescibacterota bacterium]
MKIKSEFIRNVITLMTGTSIAQVIPIAISPVLSRLYTPEEFGLFALFASVAGIISVIASGCYEFAIVLPEKDEDAINIMALSLIMAIAVSTLSFLVLWFFNSEISALLNNPEISKWLYFIPFAVFFTGSYQSFNYWLNRKKQFRKMAVGRITQNTAAAGTKLSLGFGGFGVSGLMAGNIFGGFAGSGLLGWQTVRDDSFDYRLISKKAIKTQAVRYKKFPIFASWSGFLNTASLHVPIILLTSLFSSTSAGLYYYSHKLLNMPMSLLGMSIGQVFFQKASEHKDNPEKLKEITFLVYKKLLYIGVFPLALIMVYGDYIFAFVFGSNWVTAGEYARVLSPWILFVFISSPISTLFDVLEKQNEELVFNIIIFLSRIAALLAGYLFFHDAYAAVILFGITGAMMWLGYSHYLLNMVHVDYIESFVFTFMIILGTAGILFLSRYFLGV